MSDSWVVPAVGSPQVPGAGPDDSAPWAAGRGQCLAAAEHAAAEIESGSSGGVLPFSKSGLVHRYLGSSLVFSGSPRLPLPSNDVYTPS